MLTQNGCHKGGLCNVTDTQGWNHIYLAKEPPLMGLPLKSHPVREVVANDVGRLSKVTQG